MMKDFKNIFPALASRILTNGRSNITVMTVGAASLLLSFVAQPLFAGLPAGKGVEDVTNNPPVGETDLFTMDDNTILSGNVLINDHDPDGDAMHVTAETKATAHGQVVIHADGTFTYTPNTNYHGGDTFTYKLCDDATPNGCCSGTVKITIVCKQDAPIGNTDEYTTTEDTKLVVTSDGVLKNDIDPDGELIKAVLGKPAQHGTLILKPDGTFTYQPSLNYNGTDTFTYYANDGKDNSAETLVTINVVPVNDPPIAVNDAITTNEDVQVNIPVLSNDTDVDNVLAGSMIIIVTQPAHGTLVVNTTTGNVKYTPNPNYYGNDSFTYKLNDPGGAFSNVATVTITVKPVNDAPIAAPDQATTPEDVPVIISVLGNDTDIDNEIDASSVVVASNPSHGSIVVQPSTGTFLYTPDKDFYGTDSFTYTVKDVSGATSLPGTVTIIVTPVNDAPVAVNDAITTNEDVPVNIPVLSNDSDVDNVLTGAMIIIATQPAHGKLVVNISTGKVKYTPTPNYYGNDSFTYKLKDTGGAFSNVATVTITVNQVNDAPIAAPDQATTPEDVPVVISVLDNDTDKDNAIDASSVAVASNPSHGSIVVQPSTGTFLYTPDKDFYGTDSFTYTVEDVGGATSSLGTVTITVTPVNDAPVAMDDAATTDENTPVGIPVLANDFDVDNTIDPSSLTISTNPLHGTVSINPSTGVVTYTPEPDYVGNDSFSYTVHDPAGLVSSPATVSITVINVNHPPIAVDDALDHNAVGPVTIDVLANDYDPDNAHDELSIISVTNPTAGSVSIVANEIVYTPEGNVSTTVTFTYTITDPEGLTDEAVVTIRYTVAALIISQGFSPNGDGNNDTWYIKGIESYPNNLVKVYDRWGLLVYQKSGYENTIAPWDGHGNVGQMAGKLVERGTYFYILEPGGGLKRLEGYVVVIR